MGIAGGRDGRVAGGVLIVILCGLCATCLHHDACQIRNDAIEMDKHNYFNCEADVVHCKQYLKER
jgi:hypothetical protein